jgi:glycosyltransferase involved in cell wall biosynthesis
VQVDHPKLTLDAPPVPERLSVVHVTQPLVGGVARCVIDLVSDQVERGWEVVVACPADGPLAAEVQDAGAEYLSWDATRAPGPRSFPEARRLGALLRGAQPRLVHLHSSKAALAGRLALRGSLPTIFQPHGWSFDAVAGVVERGAVAWERYATRWADLVVCVSGDERRRGEERGLRARWRVVPNAVDLDAFPPSSPDGRRDARARLGLGAGPLVVCAGRLCDAKGQDLLLEAWPSVTARVPDARLVLVGEGPDRPQLERQASGSVRLAGHSDEMAAWLAAADVVAVPSRREGMALTMLEAMASARSVVSTDVPGAREALGDDAGAVVPIGDVYALAAALAERLLDPELARREGEAGRRHAAERHDLRSATEAIARLYGEVLAAREPSYVP